MKPPKIEKNVAITSRIPSNRDWAWLKNVEVGDSFVLPAKDKHDTTTNYHVSKWGNKNNRSFISRWDEAAEGRRYWRTV